MVAVVLERPRLAHQPIDDVPIVDQMLVPAPQPRQRLHQPLAVADFQMLGVHADVHMLADQPALHRVRVAVDSDQASRADTNSAAFERLLTLRRQRAQHRQLLFQPLCAARIAQFQKLAQEPLVIVDAGKLPAAPQQKRLVHRVLKVTVGRLDVAVLVSLPGLDLLRLHPQVVHQTAITGREFALLRQVVDSTAQPVRAVTLRHSAQLPQRTLQPFAETLKALRVAQRRPLPVRIGQHEMVHHVVQGLPIDCHLQVAHPSKVRRAQTSRMVHLREEDFLVRSFGGAPRLHPALERPQLAVLELPRMLPLQPLKQRLGLQLRMLLQLLVDFRPDLFEWVLARPPVMRSLHFAGQPPQVPVLASRFLVHAHLQRRPVQRYILRQKLPKLPHLNILSHPQPPAS